MCIRDRCITSFGVYSEILATWHEFPETEEKARENLYKATGREFRKQMCIRDRPCSARRRAVCMPATPPPMTATRFIIL